jgi:hypothetical protein
MNTSENPSINIIMIFNQIETDDDEYEERRDYINVVPNRL